MLLLGVMRFDVGGNGEFLFSLCSCVIIAYLAKFYKVFFFLLMQLLVEGFLEVLSLFLIIFGVVPCV